MAVQQSISVHIRSGLDGGEIEMKNALVHYGRVRASGGSSGESKIQYTIHRAHKIIRLISRSI